MKPYMTGLIIALVWIGFFAVALGLFMSNLGVNYDYGMNTSYIDDYNHLEELREVSNEIQNSTDVNVEEGLDDIIGNYITEGYKSLKIAAKSMTMFSSMTVNTIDNEKIPMGEVGTALRTAIMVSVIVLVFLGVVISAIMKWQL